ncbi:MAG: hypothetical protein IPJ40_03865 [Saprospirales bacterium]|nr:hypothetical protein [Saprospirales bacterium]
MEIEKLFKLEKEDLLLMLIPEEEKTAYSREGMIPRGIEIFNNLLDEHIADICQEYCKRKLEFKTMIDGAKIIIAVLLTQDSIASNLIPAFTVLLLKYGLDKICNC